MGVWQEWSVFVAWGVNLLTYLKVGLTLWMNPLPSVCRFLICCLAFFGLSCRFLKLVWEAFNWVLVKGINAVDPLSC